MNDPGRPARRSFGGDDHIFVEFDEEMNLPANFRVMAVTATLAERRIDGVIDICPANVSYQVRFDPDRLAPRDLVAELEAVEAAVGDGTDFDLRTTILELPILYGDPWTRETGMRFRSHRQAPDATDLEYAARVNGFDSVADFVAAHAGSPWFASMVGFVAGLPFLFQMVPRERQLEVPKYLSPRTDTPKLTIGHGGCFGSIYSVRGAGGYQMLGITPAPIYDPTQTHPDFANSLVFFEPGFIVKYEPIDRATYDELAAQVEARRYRIRQAPVEFSLGRFLADPDGYNRGLVEVLRGD